MKNLITFSKPDDNHELEAMIIEDHKIISKQAYNDGKFDGLKSPSLPLAHGDKLANYISIYKVKYEQLVLKILQKCHPASRLPEGKVDILWAEKHAERLLGAIKKLGKLIELLKGELESFDPAELALRIKKCIAIGIALCIGEIFLNTRAFQTTGDNMLTSLGLSISVALCISLGAHIAGRQCKDAKTKFKRRMILLFSALGIIAISSVIASFRTALYHLTGDDTNPLWFTILNIVFFVVPALFTWYLYPSKEEMEENRENLHKHNEMKKMEKEKADKEQELMEHEISTKEMVKEHLRIPVQVEYIKERVRGLFRETAEGYKKGNRQSRSDNCDCLADAVPDLDISEFRFETNPDKFKKDETNKRNIAA